MADAPKILKDESLRTSYPKLNQAIDNANEALLTANTAKTYSDSAVTTANAANAKSDDTQQQLNNIVINNGQSDAEVLQARGPYAVLNDRLNDTDAQLAENAADLGVLLKRTTVKSILEFESYATKDANGIILDWAPAFNHAINGLSPTYGGVILVPYGEFPITTSIIYKDRVMI